MVGTRLPWLTLLTAAVVVSGTSSPTVHDHSQNPSDPYVIKADDQRRTPIGLVYTPENLAALIAEQPTGSLSPRITEAVRQQTPIVVIWIPPIPPEVGPTPPPYKIAIMESGGPENPNRVEPLWLQHDVIELGRLDERVRPTEVGAIAAFPRAAFAPGRRICLYSDYPPDYEKQVAKGIRRCAPLEFDARASRRK